jgi:transcription termination/antitermination protein NusG
MSRWYIIHAYSGFENKVRDAILADAERLGLTPLVESVEVPTEMVTEVSRGKKVQRERKFFPGYVLAKLRMTDDVYHLIKNQPKVTGFLGASKPQPITEAEAARILNTKAEAAASPKTKIKVDYEIGDSVKVLEGPFASFNGIVEELDFDRSRVKVSVSIFGRATPVELEFEQVERSK